MRLPFPLQRWLLIAGAVCCSGGQTLGAQTIPLRYAQSYSAVRSIFSLPVSVGERAGFFRREKLDFQVVVPLPGGSDKMIDALNDGSADLTHIATPFLIRAALAGSDAVAIAGEFNNPIYSLVAKPEIKSFADLKGKLIGLADEAGTITISTRKLLALHGSSQRGFSFQDDRGNAGALHLFAARRVRRGAARTTARFSGAKGRISAARTIERSRARVSLHRDRGAAPLGRSQ